MVRRVMRQVGVKGYLRFNILWSGGVSESIFLTKNDRRKVFKLLRVLRRGER